MLFGFGGLGDCFKGQRLKFQWEVLNARIEPAMAGKDLVILFSPNSIPDVLMKVIIESGML